MQQHVVAHDRTSLIDSWTAETALHMHMADLEFRLGLLRLPGNVSGYCLIGREVGATVL